MEEDKLQPFRLLVVDDNPDIHDDFKKILLDANKSTEDQNLQRIESKLFKEESKSHIYHYKIDSAYQGDEALKLIKESIHQKQPYALVFMDVLMPPGEDGIETTKQVWELDPNIQVVICTAYADYSWEGIVEKLGISDRYVILKKPFDAIEIRQLAASLTRKWVLNQQAGHRFDSLNDEIIEETKKLKKMFEKFDKPSSNGKSEEK